MKRTLDVLVLECPWYEDLADATSVRLFIKGWADLSEINMSYRMYHDKEDLVRWLKSFIRHPEIKVCYVAGHGRGGRLCGFEKDINFIRMAGATKGRGRGGRFNKGILIGACEVGEHLEKFLNNCGSRINWVAGYDGYTPWMEGTICDLLFLEYMFNGRSKVKKEGGFVESNDEQDLMKTKLARRAAKWVKEDFKLAIECGFRAIDRG